MSLDQYYTVSCLIRNTCINLKLKIVLVRVRYAHQKLHVFFNVCICAEKQKAKISNVKCSTVHWYYPFFKKSLKCINVWN